MDRISKAQRHDADTMRLIQMCMSKSRDEELWDFSLDSHGSLHWKNRIVVPSDSARRHDILDYSHRSKYTIHPDSVGKCGLRILKLNKH